MKDTIDNPARRRFLRLVAGLSAGGAALGLVGTSMAADASPKKVSESDSLAKNLNYHKDASQVTMASHKDGQVCAKCKFFQGKSGDKWGGCQIFQGRLVAAKGWCSSFVAAS